MIGWVEIFDAKDQTNSRIYKATHPLTLKRSQIIVGGFIEAVPEWRRNLHNDGTLYDAVALCNEDGKGQLLPVNRLATTRWAQAIPMPLVELLKRDILVGNIVLAFGDHEFMNDWI